MMRIMLFLVAASALLVASTFAVPQQINYQGYLTDTGGSPLDTTVAMTFKLYTDSLAGSLLWTETRPSIVVTDGLFNVRLGQVTTLGDAVFNNAQIWLGITVGNNSEMAPRSRIVSVSYAYRVGTVDGAAGGTITGDVNIDGKANIGSGNVNSGAYAFVAGRINGAGGEYSAVGGGYGNSAGGSYATVGGGAWNRARGSYSVIAGGGGMAPDSSIASGDYSTISGGNANAASGTAATVSGGRHNSASGLYSVVAGGGGETLLDSNCASGDYSAIGGGYSNRATLWGATISGGVGNIAQTAAVVGGGQSNHGLGDYATVSGGSSNEASGSYATVSGGSYNLADTTCTTVAGGYANYAMARYSTVSGGRYNRARGQYSVVSGGGGISAVDSNSASGDYSAIGGGNRNGIYSSSAYSTIGGGYSNHVFGNVATIAGGYDNYAGGQEAVVGGGRDNQASGLRATVAGGYSNAVYGSYAAVGGGYNTTIDSHATYATVGGGYNNTVTEYAATVGGGYMNEATENYATVGGGASNSCTGLYAMIPGGHANRADGDYSFAAGRRAVAGSDGCFVWADASTSDSFGGYWENSFWVRASGGYLLYSNTALTSGVKLLAGANAWTSVSDSTKKRNTRLVDTKDVLNRVAQLPIEQWSYKSQDPSIEHIGPMAQDFWRLFHLGEDSLGISTIDPDGIALAAIQELQKQNAELKKELNELRSLVEKMATQHDSNSGKAASAAFQPKTQESTLKEITQ